MDDRRFTLGYCTFIGSNLVIWCNKKQPVVVRSNAEAKFKAMAHGICEMLLTHDFLRELGFSSKGLMRLYCESVTTKPPLVLFTILSRHIEIDKHL